MRKILKYRMDVLPAKNNCGQNEKYMFHKKTGLYGNGFDQVCSLLHSHNKLTLAGRPGQWNIE